MQKKKEPKFGSFMCLGAENETRTRDPNLGKVVLYQLSYFRRGIWFVVFVCVKRRRLELPRRNWHYPLKVARLPIPPPLHYCYALFRILCLGGQAFRRFAILLNGLVLIVPTSWFRIASAKLRRNVEPAKLFLAFLVVLWWIFSKMGLYVIGLETKKSKIKHVSALPSPKRQAALSCN